MSPTVEVFSIVIAFLVVIGTLLLLWSRAPAETSDEARPDADEFWGDQSFDDNHVSLVSEIGLPGEMPHRSRFIKAGVETLNDLRKLDSLQDVYGIGPSRSSDICRWFRESNLHSNLPWYLVPEREMAAALRQREDVNPGAVEPEMEEIDLGGKISDDELEKILGSSA